MGGKALGYIIAIIGLAVVAIGSLPFLRSYIPFIPASIKDLYIMIAGVVIAILGFIPIMKSSKDKQPTEVPIYHGDKVVGFRRLGKK